MASLVPTCLLRAAYLSKHTALRGCSTFHSLATLKNSSLLRTVDKRYARLNAMNGPPFMNGAVGAAVRTKVSERTLRRKNLRKMKKKAANIPNLKDTLRKLYMRTHPDLFGQYPEQRDTNEQSYKELLGILDSIEKNHEFPLSKSLDLPFFLKTPIEGQFHKVSLSVRMSGGACNNVMEEALGRFFEQCGLPAIFEWKEGSWGKHLSKDQAENSNLSYEKEDEEQLARQREREAEEAEEKLRKAAPAYQQPFPSNTPHLDKKAEIEDVLMELNDVFEIIAAIPLMDDEEYGELRRYYEFEGGLEEIENRGYKITDATHRIWKGERDVKVLTKDLDADSALMVQRILMHAIVIDQKIARLMEDAKKEMEELDQQQAAEEIAETAKTSEQTN